MFWNHKLFTLWITRFNTIWLYFVTTSIYLYILCLHLLDSHNHSPLLARLLFHLLHIIVLCAVYDMMLVESASKNRFSIRRCVVNYFVRCTIQYRHRMFVSLLIPTRISIVLSLSLTHFIFFFFFQRCDFSRFCLFPSNMDMVMS